MATPEVMTRELRGIPETAAHLGLDQATVVTYSEERVVEAEGGITIRIVPAWKWLLREG